MNRYRHEEKIGKGAYGIVYKSKDLLTDKYVALKKIRLEVEEEGIPSSSLREISYLRMLQFIKHPNIVLLDNIVIEANRLHLIFELVDGDLKKLIEQSPNGLDLPLIKSFTSQILDGIAYMHSMGIMHRDLKPQNLLVSHGGAIKIADFGLARSFSAQKRELTVEVVTRWYRAPEILLGCAEYAASVDIWSVGCIIAEMTNHTPFFPSDSDIDQIHRIFRVLGTPVDHMWPEFQSLPYARNNFPMWPPIYSLSILVPRLCSNGVNLLESIFRYDPSKRISAVEALHHPFCENPLPSTPKSRPAPLALTDVFPSTSTTTTTAATTATTITRSNSALLKSITEEDHKEKEGEDGSEELPKRRRSTRVNVAQAKPAAAPSQSQQQQQQQQQDSEDHIQNNNTTTTEKKKRRIV